MDTPFSLQRRLWQEVTLLALALVGVFSALCWPLLKSGNEVFAMSVAAATSGILLAMSFSLSSFAHYFDFLDDKVVYRKQLGLMGYFFALGYALLVAGTNQELYVTFFPQNLLTVEVGLGVLAMAILTVMALISNSLAMRLLGGRLWKGILGLGYIAYAILVIRALFLDAFLWETWFTHEDANLTIRMILTAIGIAVLLFRASVPFHKKYSKKTNYV